MRIVLADASPNAPLVAAASPGVDTGFLYSFAYAHHFRSWNAAIRAGRIRPRTWLDSGVFTFRKENRSVPVESLIAYALQNADCVNHVFSMDEGTIDEQVANVAKMTRAGVPTIAIYHSDMPLGTIERFREHTDYVAISFHRTGGPGTSESLVAIDTLFTYLYERNLWPIKVHGLGVEKVAVLDRYPFASCDASSWATVYSMRKCCMFIPERQRLLQLDPIPKQAAAYAHHAQHHLLPFQLSNPAGRYHRAVHAARERTKVQRMLTDAWAKRGVTFDV